MKVFKESKTIKSYLQNLQKDPENIFGFVPTMGALHQGHLSLIEASIRDNTQTVCSIFVNPEQFNNKKDLEAYPTNVSKDLEILGKAQCDIVFIPNYEEIYGTNYHRSNYALDGLDLILEGAGRPGHFQGVCAVVHRLLEIISPQRLYLGQKDFQQTVVLQKLVDTLNLNTEIKTIPIFREANGLAMSSRNVRLSADARQRASFIYDCLQNIYHNVSKIGLKTLLRQEVEKINAISNAKVQYLEVADCKTLKTLNQWDESQNRVALIVVEYEGIRLLDNILLD
jgi:pantoate--beta-alanine ligase